MFINHFQMQPALCMVNYPPYYQSQWMYQPVQTTYQQSFAAFPQVPQGYHQFASLPKDEEMHEGLTKFTVKKENQGRLSILSSEETQISPLTIQPKKNIFQNSPQNASFTYRSISNKNFSKIQVISSVGNIMSPNEEHELILTSPVSVVDGLLPSEALQKNCKSCFSLDQLQVKMEKIYGTKNTKTLLETISSELMTTNLQRATPATNQANLEKSIYLTILTKTHENFSLGQQNSQTNKFFILKEKSETFLQQFDFSDVRQNQSKAEKAKRDRKPNSSYIKNSQFHNLNKLFMYNILSMYRIDALQNIGVSSDLIQELAKIILRLKLSSRRDYKDPQRGFFDYFSHGHYKVLFLQLNDVSIQSIRENEVELDLHEQCFNCNLNEDISPMELSYMNIIKGVNFQIFMKNIQEHKLFNDGTETKQNIRRKYTLKVISGIKKLAKGIPIKRF